jgi:hypothetical protein
MAAIAVVAVLLYYVFIPVWDYYHLPPATRAVLAQLNRTARLSRSGPMPLGDLLKAVRLASGGPTGGGVPVYVDPNGLSEAEAGIGALVQVPSGRQPLKTLLSRSLKPLKLGVYVRDGLLTVTSEASVKRAKENDPKGVRIP